MGVNARQDARACAYAAYNSPTLRRRGQIRHITLVTLLSGTFQGCIQITVLYSNTHNLQYDITLAFTEGYY